MPEHDVAAETAVADTGDEFGEGLRRVDRVDEDPSVEARSAVASSAAVTGPRSRRRAGRRSTRSRSARRLWPVSGPETVEDRHDRRLEFGGRGGDGDTDDGAREPAQPKSDEEARLGPAGRRREDDGRGRDIVVRGLGREFKACEHLARGAGRAAPAHRHEKRPPARRPQVRNDTFDERDRAARSSVVATWIVAPNNASSRSFGPGVAAGGPVRTTWTSSPAFAPAAAVSRQWFDQRRPDVTSVSAPWPIASPTMNSRFRSLFPPNANGSRSSRLIQTTASPPRAAENRSSRWNGEGPSSRVNRGSAAIPAGMTGGSTDRS